MKGNSIFVCDDKKYGTAPDGSTVFVGPVSKPTETPPVPQKVVLQQAIKGNVLTAPKPVEVLQQKHGGGRPRKEGEVHRTTKWRRVKQGVLL